MHSIINLSVALALIGATQAKLLTALPQEGPKGLFTRQSQAFEPGSSSGFGETCADAFGAGYIQCGSGSHCYNPGAGESCCQPSDPYACPSESFCLVDGFCCPSGLDPASCALQNGVTLPADFNTAPIPISSQAPPAATGSSSAAAVTTSAASPSSYPSHSANGTVSFNPLPTQSITPYTGGAVGSVRSYSGVFALVAGAVAALL